MVDRQTEVGWGTDHEKPCLEHADASLVRFDFTVKQYYRIVLALAYKNGASVWRAPSIYD